MPADDCRFAYGEFETAAESHARRNPWLQEPRLARAELSQRSTGKRRDPASPNASRRGLVTGSHHHGDERDHHIRLLRLRQRSELAEHPRCLGSSHGMTRLARSRPACASPRRRACAQTKLANGSGARPGISMAPALHPYKGRALSRAVHEAVMEPIGFRALAPKGNQGTSAIEEHRRAAGPQPRLPRRASTASRYASIATSSARDSLPTPAPEPLPLSDWPVDLRKFSLTRHIRTVPATAAARKKADRSSPANSPARPYFWPIERRRTSNRSVRDS